MLLRQLEYILAVQKFKSFTKAAEHCCITQPTLSQQIKVLEDVLDIEIFKRNPFSVTKEGKEILEMASDIVSKANDLKKRAKSLAKEQQGE